MRSKRTLGVVLFEGFELLDVFGPLEMFGLAADHFEIRLISESGGVVASRQGPKSICDDSFQSAPAIDVLLVPGGIGTRREVNNKVLLDWLKERSQQAELVASVCTGSALLAKAGVLDGLRATSNKLAFAWAASQSEKVQWQQQARWIEDGKVFSSSGVSAGIDMALAVIAKLVSLQAAEDAANFAEYTWQRDADCDPFASVVGVSESA
jgi:putative intracellular protease/amidase